jgi:CubicO group peptidase (beta-lactamase class C family)
MRIRGSLCIVGAVLVLVSACSSSSNDRDSATTTGGGAATSTTTKPDSATSTTVPPFSDIDALVASSEPVGVGAVFVGAFDGASAELAAAGVDGDGNQVTPDRAWETASLVKMIVATSVLQLVDQGFVALDAPIGTYVDIPIADSIVVRDVLSHRSGIPDMQQHLSSYPTEETLDVMKGEPRAPRHRYQRRATRIATTSCSAT